MKPALLALLGALVLAFVPTTVEGSVGSGGTTSASTGREKSPRPSRKAKPKKVRAGEHHDNGDVSVDNDPDSGGEATIDPDEGSSTTATTVRTSTGFKGSVSGVDGNDAIHLGAANLATVNGIGGNVYLSGGSDVTINNLGGEGAMSMTIHMTSGTTITVPPGSQGVRIQG